MGLQRTRQLTILFIGHDLALMEQFCDRLLVLDAGRVAECGYTADLLTAPSSQATRHLVENSVGFLLEAAA
jgi:peptide/nickel transport system ATP-binding protein